MANTTHQPNTESPVRSTARHHSARFALAGLIAASMIAVGCSGAAASPEQASSKSGHATTQTSDSGNPADEICEDMVRKNVVLQVSTGKVIGQPARTKAGTVTTCVYKITDGSLWLAVDDRATDAEASRTFTGLKDTAGQTKRVANLGSAAYTQADGTTVTVLDDKVLTVDPTRLPTGNDRTQIAQSLSFQVLNCWTG